MVHRLGVALLFALQGACGRVGYDPSAGSRPPGEDAAAAVDARPGWDARSMDAMPCAFGPWSAPERIEGLGVSTELFGPAPSPDGLTLIFSRVTAPGDRDSEDLYLASRADRDAPFGAASPIAELNTPAQDGTPFLASNDELWFSSSRSGTLGGVDLWHATRTGPEQPFGPALHHPELSSTSIDYLPALPADGLTVYFASRRGGGGSEEDLWRATRPDRDSAFGAPAAATELNTGDFDTSPFLSRDGLELYIASDRAGGGSGLDLYVATRPDAGSAFSAPALVDGVNSGDNEEDPAISADGRELFFASNRDGPFRLWRSTRSCL